LFAENRVEHVDAETMGPIPSLSKGVPSNAELHLASYGSTALDCFSIGFCVPFGEAMGIPAGAEPSISMWELPMAAVLGGEPLNRP